jgi:hypothetical protein
MARKTTKQFPAISPRDQKHSDGDRRSFLSTLLGGATASLLVGAVDLKASSAEAASESNRIADRTGHEERDNRSLDCLAIRREAALVQSRIPMPNQANNGDEQRFPNLIGNFSKGLPHNLTGEVDKDSYQLLLRATALGTSTGFENVPLGGSAKLVNPLAGVCFDLEGPDSHQLAIAPPPSVSSQPRADDMVELYWMALCRDVNFTAYASNPLSQKASDELSTLHGFVGPRSGKNITPQILFRGVTPDDLLGPYVSQFLLKPFNYGQIPVSGQIITYKPEVDYLTDAAVWLAVQNGRDPFENNQTDSELRYIRNGRDLAAYVHNDQVFQAFYNAGVWLSTHGAPSNPGNPYRSLSKQSSFATFGPPCFLPLLAEVSSRALKAVWYSKWFVHRTLRPEEYGGLVHRTKSGIASYPLHEDVLNSEAVAQVFARNGSYLHPQVYPEGCPLHPSYAQGHATLAGACATILKIAFDGRVAFNTLRNGAIVTASEDGSRLSSYTGPDADQITVNGEINKLASNIAMARNFAGIHWRSDYSEGLKLGEAVALSILREQRACYAEPFSGFTITKFDGASVTV